MAKEKFDLKKMVTDKLIAALEAEIAKGDDAIIPWSKPWNAGMLAQNLNSKREYRGFLNQFFLMMAGFESPYWNTYEGWRELGYRQWAKREKVKIEDADIKSVRSKRKKFEKTEVWLERQTDNVRAFFEAGGAGVEKGAKSEIVIYNKRVANKKFDKDNPDNGPEFWFILRYFSVFNSEQTFGIEVPKHDSEGIEFKPIKAAEKLWKDWSNAPKVTHNGNSAHYVPATDRIGMPPKNKFHSVEAYYKTKFHEGIHATGHEDRLNRPEITKLDKSSTEGLERYSFEELTAEMGACILAAQCNLSDVGDSEQNSVAYMRGWIKRLKDDTSLAIKASTKAAAAVDHITGVTYDNDDTEKDGDK